MIYYAQINDTIKQNDKITTVLYRDVALPVQSSLGAASSTNGSAAYHFYKYFIPCSKIRSTIITT